MKVIVILTILAAANAAILPNYQSKYSKCDKGCPLIYLPVCGDNGNGEHKIFANDCHMDVENCKLQIRNEAVYTEAPMTMCEIESDQSENQIDCNKPCLDIYAPVCGYDGEGKYNTFANECVMDVENCNRKSRNEIGFNKVSMEMCKNHEQSNEIVMIQNDNEDAYKHCNKPCIDIYAPVCGYDGHIDVKIFASECDMETENCRVQVRQGSVYMRLPLENCEVLDSELRLISANKKNNCNQICTADYNPICGFNGIEYRTFANICDLEVQNCGSNFNWRFTKEGECTSCTF